MGWISESTYYIWAPDAVSCESGFWTIEKWKVKKKCHSLFSRSASEFFFTWDRDREMKVKWKTFEIEKWNFSRIIENFRELKNHSWHTLFWVPHPPRMVNFFYEIWCQISLFFLEKKGDIFSPFTLFEKWKWNRNDWKSRSRSESEIKMTRDREVKFQKNSRESGLSQVIGKDQYFTSRLTI